MDGEGRINICSRCYFPVIQMLPRGWGGMLTSGSTVQYPEAVLIKILVQCFTPHP